VWRLAFFEVISHLVKDRMDITGARWGLPGAEAILKLRALHSNGDFPEYWHHHLDQEQQRIHRSRYAKWPSRRVRSEQPGPCAVGAAPTPIGAD
jgi:hypothetical protein